MAELVTSALKPLYSSNHIDKETYKNIAKSAVNKVMSSRPSSAPAELSEKEKAKIKDLVEKYVKKSNSGWKPS